MARWTLRQTALCMAALASGALADDILSTSGFTNCNANADIGVDKADISYNAQSKVVTFDVSGHSNKEQNVTATLSVAAYGQSVYSNTFNPCDAITYVQQLCPVPVGNFSAHGTQNIPEEAASLIPSIAFQIPDIAAFVTLTLNNLDTGEETGCVESQVSNGKTINVPAVTYVAAGIAAAALVLGGISAAGGALAGAGSVGGTGTTSPGFTEVMGVFQSYSQYGMLSVNLPQVYRGFTKSFAFSTGIIPWSSMQTAIDGFRGSTGGDLSKDSFAILQNTTLIFPDGTTTKPQAALKRAVAEFASIIARQIETNVNGTTSGDATTTPQDSGVQSAVSGVEAFVKQVSVPSANSFMTVLLITAIVIAAIIVGILLVKVVLEAWAIFGKFPESLAGFREHYWGSIARSITSLIMVLYGVWVLYSVFQFTHGDSWAAQTLAGVTLFVFTAILAFFTWKIMRVTRKLKEAEGDASGLYEKKEIWLKYSLFYDAYKKSYWWVFIPVIIYMLAKGMIVAALDGSGMAQTIGLIVVETLMLGLLIWHRPFERKSSNIINIFIQVVRVLSVVCILVFVDQFGIAQSTQSIVGIVLIALQSTLAGILAILLVWNAFILCCKENPHRKRRKEMEKMQRDMDVLTPLDARNSLLMEPSREKTTTFAMTSTATENQRLSRDSSPERYMGQAFDGPNPNLSLGVPGNGYNRALTPTLPFNSDPSRDNLLSNAAPIGRHGDYSRGSAGNGYNPGYGGYRGGY